ncbi:MAG: DEAD/DEAH box helicase family protein, partial [Spirochaetales bacterium]|nr:DEAD/DEAH box helicase family protein [Spirochaetales bacterium]
MFDAGWKLDKERDREYEVTGMPNNKGIGFADYVLWGDDGLPLAVVEAKRTSKDPAVGQHQAKLYADCLENMTGRRPVIFYTNGYETYIWDDMRYPPRSISGFYTKEELERTIHRRNSINDLQIKSPDNNIAGRYYQKEAIRRVCESFQGKSRKALLVMATGSGKTRTAIALVDLLMKANWVKRILFLADRNALVKQAKDAFTEHLPDLSTINLTKDKETTGTRIVFSTYPTMMNGIDEKKGDERRFSVGYFDLIIIDEAHRSIYKKYQAIFEYFDSLILGLTATPKEEVDRNTYKLFGIENGVPTNAYELDQAVKDGFLVPYKGISVPVRFHQNGIKYDELSKEEKAEYEEKFYDNDSESLPKWIESPKLNTLVFNEDTTDKILTFLMEYGQKVEGG